MRGWVEDWSGCTDEERVLLENDSQRGIWAAVPRTVPPRSSSTCSLAAHVPSTAAPAAVNGGILLNSR